MSLSLKKNTPLLIGNALEYYDVMLYGFFASILAPQFFPHDDPLVSQMAAVISYAITFVARPLGGVVFGHYGDKWGRKNTLSFSILLVTIPTLGIALLPGYETIGVAAPILLLSLRFLQGFCLGGESSGAMTYFIESAPHGKKDMASSLLVMSCYVGTLVATLFGAFFTQSFMPTWGWRLTFFIGSLIAIVGYYIRRKMNESPEFIKTQEKGEVLDLPLLDLFLSKYMQLFYSAILAASIVAPFFVIFVNLGRHFVTDMDLSTTTILLYTSSLMAFWIALLPIFGYLAQVYGRKRVMTFGLLGLMAFAYPLFLQLEVAMTAENILITQFALSVFAIAYAAPSSAMLVELFPVNQRYSGIAVGYSLGHAIFGGLAPVLVANLVLEHQIFMAPVYFVSIVAALAGLIIHHKEIQTWFTPKLIEKPSI